MDYAKRIGQVGALAVVLGGGGGGDYPRDRLCRADGSELLEHRFAGRRVLAVGWVRQFVGCDTGRQCATGRRATGRPRKHPR